MRSFDLSEFPPDLANEIRERAEAQHVPPAALVADLVRVGLRQSASNPPREDIDPRWLPSPPIIDTGEVSLPVNIPRPPGVRCTNVRVVEHRPISNLILWDELEGHG